MSAVRPSEPPLSVFVSSVMSEDLQWARDTAFKVLDEPHWLKPWMFEHTPPSSESADTAYLRNVAEADIVVWLVGDRTTPPVRKEIETALANHRRLLIIKLPSATRDDVTMKLMQTIGLTAKWGELGSEEELNEVLREALGDEIVRAVRLGQPTHVIVGLASQYQLSLARCTSRWEAIGVSPELASALARETGLGTAAADLLPTATRPLRIWLGDMGIGKSLACERYLQENIAAFRENGSLPVPVYVEATEVGSSLDELAAERSTGIGDIKRQGLSLVVDSMDEVTADRASLILQQAKVLVNALPLSRAVLASRPLSIYLNPAEIVQVPP